MNTKPFALNSLASKPYFEGIAKGFIQELNTLPDIDLQKVMDVNPALLREVKEMLSRWGKPKQVSTPAAALYNGDAYMRLCSRDWDAKSWTFAKDHLFILSAVYGVLRATDNIQPYRLMVGSRWQGKSTPRGLYPFWQEELKKWAKGSLKKKVVINLASQEYAAMLDRIELPRINLDFKVSKGGKLTTVSSFSKQARGAMARWMVEHQPEHVQDLQKVEVMGFCYDADHSDKENWIYIKA